MTAQHDDRKLGEMLRQLAEDPADDGFASRLHLRLAQAGAPAPAAWFVRVRAWPRERPMWAGLLVGATSGVAAFALMSAVVSRPIPGGPADVGQQPVAVVEPARCEPQALAHVDAEVFVVPEGKVALVQLHFAVERDVESAEFDILLPEGLAFFSDGKRLTDRSFRWVAPLTRGDNRVPIAVVGTRPGLHRLAATATIAGEVVVHEVVLDVRGDA
jgi:hypothetical protein